jgi:hypothetical protein
MLRETYASFDEFWLDFLRVHSLPVTRSFHYLGMFAAGAALLMFLTSSNVVWLLAMIAAPYAFGFFGHGVFEKNQPATFRHPAYSARAALRMFFFWLTGRLKPELARAGLSTSSVF